MNTNYRNEEPISLEKILKYMSQEESLGFKKTSTTFSSIKKPNIRFILSETKEQFPGFQNLELNCSFTTPQQNISPGDIYKMIPLTRAKKLIKGAVNSVNTDYPREQGTEISFNYHLEFFNEKNSPEIAGNILNILMQYTENFIRLHYNNARRPSRLKNCWQGYQSDISMDKTFEELPIRIKEKSARKQTIHPDINNKDAIIYTGNNSKTEISLQDVGTEKISFLLTTSYNKPIENIDHFSLGYMFPEQRLGSIFAKKFPKENPIVRIDPTLFCNKDPAYDHAKGQAILLDKQITDNNKIAFLFSETFKYIDRFIEIQRTFIQQLHQKTYYK